MSSTSFTPWPQLNDETLRNLAGEGAFARGYKYARDGRVALEICSKQQISGRVRGTANYSVILCLDGDSLRGDCNCPVGDEGDFCKHQVAVALAARGDAPSESQPSAQDKLSSFLREQSVDLLVEKLLSFAAQFREVEKELSFWHKSSKATSNAELNKVVGALLRGGGFVDYRKSFDYARRVEQVSELVRGLLSKNPAQCAEATEYALLRLFKTLEQSDDSAGAVSGAMDELVQLHLKALSVTSPDKKFGQRFFKLMLADGWGFFKLEQYRPILGAPAWAEYGRCLEVAYAKLPQISPHKSRFVVTKDDAERSALIRLLENWYASNDDRDALLALKISALDQPWDYDNLIRQLRQFERHREALLWAEKSLHLFPEDARFYELLAERYRHDGCDVDANKVLWQWFEKWPFARHFPLLMSHAGEQAVEWRARAFAYLEQCEVHDLERRRSRDRSALRDVSARLEILLSEKTGLADAVAISRNTVANAHLVLALADQARKRYPQVSIPIYRSHIENVVERGSKQAYKTGVDYLGKLLPLLGETERSDYLLTLRTRFKAKRNFIKLLDAL